MKHTIPSVLLAALLPAGLPAQDLPSQLVPADSKCVCYVDLAGLIDFVGRDLIREGIARKVKVEAGVKLKADWLAQLTKEWGFDPLVDLQGILLFGDRPDEGATLAVLTTARIDGVLERLREMGAVESVERGGTEVLQLVPQKVAAALGFETGEGGDEAQGYLYVHRFGRGERQGRALVFGDDLQLVAEAGRSMQRGAGEGRRGARAQRAPIRAGCLVSVEIDGALADLMGDNPASKVTSKAKRFAFQLNQHEGDLQLTARIETGGEKDARQIAAIVNGLKALASLADPEDLDIPEGVMEALQEAQAKAESKDVIFELTVPRSLVEQGRRELRRELGDEPDAKEKEKKDDDEPPPRPPAGKTKGKQPARKSVDR